MALAFRLYQVAMLLAAAHLLVGIGMVVVGNPEGWPGGVFYVLLYGVPVALIGLAVRAQARAWVTAAGWAALILAIYYTAVPIGNWSGYTAGQALFVVLITVPTVLFDLVVFWATIRRHQRPLGV